MSKNNAVRHRQIKSILLMSGFALMSVTLFQNCGGFKSLRMTNDSSTNPMLRSVGIMCSNKAAVTPTPIYRMTKTQIRNTINSVFGSAVGDHVKGAVSLLPEDSIASHPDDFEMSFQNTQLEIVDQLSRQVSSFVGADNKRLTDVAGECSVSDAVTADCFDQFLLKFGKKALRRPLLADDLAHYKKIYDSQGGNRAGIVGVIAALVLSPEFLYHLEVGAPSNTNPGQFALTPYEVANRISYLLTDSPPDDELVSKADNQTLTQTPVLSAQVDRILKTPAARDKLHRFFRYWLAIEKFTGVPSAKNALAGLDPSGLEAELKREFSEYIDHIVFEKRGSFQDLLTSRRSFARTPAAAQVYGQKGVHTDGAVLETDANHIGLLTRTPVIGNPSPETHLIVRGAMFRRRVLCTDIPAPTQADLLGRDAQKFVPDPIKYSNREMVAQRTETGRCLGCHRQMNPIGYVFQQYDNFGRFRTVEQMFDGSGNVIATHPVVINENIELSATEQVHVTNATDFVAKLATSVQAPACFSKQVFRFYSVRSETDADGCHITEIFNAISAKNGSVLDAIKAAVVGTYSVERSTKQ